MEVVVEFGEHIAIACFDGRPAGRNQGVMRSQTANSLRGVKVVDGAPTTASESGALQISIEDLRLSADM
jgi:hypothetical protein